MRTWHAAAVAVGAAAFTAGGFGIAQAATAIPPNTIHGCVDVNHNRTLNRVYISSTSGTVCPTGSFQVIWPNGADTDAAPAAVTAGPSGLDVVEVSQGTNADVAVAACPVDHPYVLGGGYTGGPDVVTDIPRPPIPPFTSTSNTGGWTVQASPGGSVGAFAICAK
jgi:hypothetical protein